jgi:hypothetical protein
MDKLTDTQTRHLAREFDVYRRKARQQHIIFMLDLDEFVALSLQPCFYCHYIEEIGFNGIDRLDQTKGYATENCVAYCDQCCITKGSLDTNTFIRRMIHITGFHGACPNYANNTFLPDLFPNSKAISYACYRSRAMKQRNCTFELSENDYREITSMPCYLCGKETTSAHRNGVAYESEIEKDRYPHRVYSKEFCRPCCRECHSMKNNIPLSAYLRNAQTIAALWQADGKELPDTPQQLHFTASLSQKKTKEEWREEKKLRVQHKVARAKASLSSKGGAAAAATEAATLTEPTATAAAADP